MFQDCLMWNCIVCELIFETYILIVIKGDYSSFPGIRVKSWSQSCMSFSDTSCLFEVKRDSIGIIFKLYKIFFKKPYISIIALFSWNMCTLTSLIEWFDRILQVFWLPMILLIWSTKDNWSNSYIFLLKFRTDLLIFS